MKFFKKMKDGGAESSVTGYWLIEAKSLFSVVLIKFDGKSRNAYHEHAFNCINWLVKGKLKESRILEIDPVDKLPNRMLYKTYKPSLLPFIIKREHYHLVDSEGISWVISFRGPWSKTWKEYLPNENRERTLTNGRVEIG